MKKILLLAFCLFLFNANFASAQSGPGGGRESESFIDRAINAFTTEATTTERQAPREPSATSTPVVAPPESTPAPAPVQEIVPDPKPTPQVPSPQPTPAPEPQATTTPLVGSSGASADPEVLAAQNSTPTAGAGNVYQGNTLSWAVTQFLLFAALCMAVAGIVISNRGLIPTRNLSPVRLVRSGI